MRDQLIDQLVDKLKQKVSDKLVDMLPPEIQELIVLLEVEVDEPGILDGPVSSVMDAPYPVLDGHMDADEVRRLLQRGNAACLVRDGTSLVGIVTRYDVLHHMQGIR